MLRIAGAVIGAALQFLSLPAHSAAGSSTAALKVLSLDLLSVTSGGAIVLDSSAADAATGVVGPVSDSAARLNYTQNSALNKKITAQVTANPGGSDITLSVSVAGGAGPQTLVSGGVTSAAQNVYTNIAAGALSNRAVTYTAQATAAGTKVSATTDFVFTVTFTSTN